MENMAQKFLEDVDNTFAGAVSYIESQMKHRKTAVYDKSKVLVSTTQVKNILRKDKRFGNASKNNLITAIIAGAYVFKKTKQIFKVDIDLCEELFRDAEELDHDCEIPCDALINLPYQGFYIEFPRTDDFYSAVMVSMDYGYFQPDSEEACYAISLVMENYPVISSEDSLDHPTPVHVCLPLITGGKLNDALTESIRHLIMERQELWKKDISEDELQSEMEITLLVWKQVLTVLLYICSVNADIIPQTMENSSDSKEQKNLKPTSISKKQKKTPQPKNYVWNVGFRIGPELKAHRNTEKSITNSEKGIGKGGIKRSHLRRGHFHHYWVGSPKDNSRQLVLKWIAPVVIHSQYSNQLPIVQHSVRNEVKSNHEKY